MNINITLNSKYACSADGAEYSHTNFLLVEIGYTKIVALNVRWCGRSTGERRMLNLSNILEDPPLGGSTSLTSNVPEVLFIAEPLMDIRNTLPDDMSVKPITLLL